jgi:predicted HD superfamily hydrolase involved in NAD metabolism
MCSALSPYLHGFSFTGDLYANMVGLLTQRGHPRTAGHCVRVAAQARQLAARFGEDEKSAEIAGWLHDVSAIVPIHERIALAVALDLDVLDEERRLPMIVHQKLSAIIACEAFHVTAPSVLSAIGCHTTLKAGASRLDKVVFVADKITWDQLGDPPWLSEITVALDQSLDAAALCYINYLWERRATLMVVHPWLVAAREELHRQQ